MVPPRTRNDLPLLLEELGYRTGAQLGVQYGEYAKLTLAKWVSCEQYWLVDMWRTQVR